MAVDHLLTSTHHSTMLAVDQATSQPMPNELLASVPLILVAVIVWVLEQKHHGALLTLPSFAGCVRVFRKLAPEFVGLIACIAIAGTLIQHRVHLGAPIEATDDKAIWAEINSEWPVLQTADTLLGFQAMLRFVLLGSLAARASSQGAMASFVGTPAVLLLLAASARVALLVLSPRDVYHLDGPLGGWMNAALEVAALPPLMYLTTLGANLKRTGGVAVAAALITTGVAICNHISLAEPGQTYLDVLFSMEHFFEFLASLAILHATFNNVMGEEEMVVQHPSAGMAARFAYMLLPMMQLLSAYFLITAWGGAPFKPVPELVGSGHPFELLQATGVAEVAVYVFAAVVHLGLAGADEEKGLLFNIEV